MQYLLNWQPSPVDDRDIHFAVAKPSESLPQFVDLTALMPEIWDQLNAGSCTGNGGARVLKYAANKANIDRPNPSRLFLYYNARRQEGTTGQDAGAYIRDILKGANQFGFCPETLWPYDTSKVTTQPSKAAYDEAKTDRIHIYAAVNVKNPTAIKLCLKHGYPIVFGTYVFRNFMEYTGGIIDKPSRWATPLGGHCIVISAYDDKKEAVLIDNSWGTSWGIHGRAWVSYDYLIKYASDGWMVRFIK